MSETTKTRPAHAQSSIRASCSSDQCEWSLSCHGAAYRSGGCTVRPVDVKLGFASLFLTVNPELPPLRNACSPHFLYLQKHLLSTRSRVESLFPLLSRLCECLFSALRFHGSLLAPAGRTQDRRVLQAPFCLLSMATPKSYQETCSWMWCTFVETL